MCYTHSKQTSFTPCFPSAVTNIVYQGKQCIATSGIDAMPSNTCSRDSRYVTEIAQFSGWTRPKQHRASPLISYFFLDVKSELIHPAPSRAAALDQAIYDCTLCGFTSNVCPSGTAGRVISDSLVERLRLFDGACKARFFCRGRQEKLFIAWAIQSSHGSLDFSLGKKPLRILALLSQIKNRTSHFCTWAQPFLCSAGAEHSSKKPSRLNALRVTERNLT